MQGIILLPSIKRVHMEPQSLSWVLGEDCEGKPRLRLAQWRSIGAPEVASGTVFSVMPSK
ncbi:MAG TPA: hypothetical protein DEF45_10275 [Rhodopirellula sp.]|nr:hypothetical protein [Rhodopirellula sp.]